MNRRFLLLLMIVAFVGAFAVSCVDEAKDSRSVVTVTSINDNAPLNSDVITDTMTVVEDQVTVVFYNRPYSQLVVTGPNLPFNDYIVTRYQVDFTRLDGNPSVPPSFNAAMSVNVASTEFAVATIKLVPAGHKEIPPLLALATMPGGIEMIATVTFFGSEVGISHETSFQASISVAAANFGG
ncbi:MAG: hypothetical protein O7D32_06885 [bacterium]|nr:hypothetical protein [bacterium]